MVAAGQQTDFIASLLQDGAKFLRIADDVHFLMDQMKTISTCMYALTAGVYIAIVVYVLVVCYKDRRRPHADETTALTSAAYGFQQQQRGSAQFGQPDATRLGNSSLHDIEMGHDQLDSSEQEILPQTNSTAKGKMSSRIRGAYRRQYPSSQTGAAQTPTSTPDGAATGKPKSRMQQAAAAQQQATRRANKFRDVVAATQAQQQQGHLDLNPPLQPSRGASPLPPPPQNTTDFDPSAALSVV